MSIPNHPALDTLIDDLDAAKDRLAAAKNAVFEAEQNLLDHPDIANLHRDEGTVKVGRVSVTYGLTRKWDQERLAELAKEVEPAFWPFKSEYKEDLRSSRTFEKAFPELMKKLGAALTLTPRKPSIKVAPIKGDAA